MGVEGRGDKNHRRNEAGMNCLVNPINRQTCLLALEEAERTSIPL